MSSSPNVTTTRPPLVVVTITLLFFLGVTAVAGSLALIFDLGGGAPPEEWLDGIPLIDGWLVPGLVLGIGFGMGSLVAAYGWLRRPIWRWLDWLETATRHHWAWLATILIGAGHVLWIGVELALLPDPAWLQLVYGPLGLALMFLPLAPSVSRYVSWEL